MTAAEAVLFYSTLGIFATVTAAITVGAVLVLVWGVEVFDEIKHKGW